MKALHARAGLAALVACLFVSAASAQAGRAQAEVSCEPAAEHLVFDCAVRLTNRHSGEPLEGARITVNADMPSMPMVHHVSPVQTEPTAEPGLYRLRIALEMPGVWILRLDIRGPMRDLLVIRMDFGSGAGGPSGSAEEPHAKGHHEHVDRGPPQEQERQGQ
jgi:hypothetical protein